MLATPNCSTAFAAQDSSSDTPFSNRWSIYSSAKLFVSGKKQYPQNAENGKYDKSPPTDVCDRNGSNLYDREDRHPVD